MNIDLSSVAMKTESDSNDECSHDDKPSTGMFAVSGDIFSAVSCLFSYYTLRVLDNGDRAFPVTGARVWNALPSSVTDSATVATFKSYLKTYLFARSLS